MNHGTLLHGLRSFIAWFREKILYHATARRMVQNFSRKAYDESVARTEKGHRSNGPMPRKVYHYRRLVSEDILKAQHHDAAKLLQTFNVDIARIAQDSIRIVATFDV